MIPFYVGQSKNGQPTFEIQTSDTIRTFVLDGSTEVSLVVPADCNKALFVPTNNFYLSRSSFSIPSGTSVNTSTIRLNPNVETVTAGETLYFRSISADTHVNISFYKGGA